MNQNNRNRFDQQVEWVLARLPQEVLHILKEVPLHVEDQPSKRLMQKLKISDPEALCGYFCGVPHGQSNWLRVVYFGREVRMPNSITIFRRGIVAKARDEWEKVRRSSLRQQIRITLLRELAHLHGMGEEEIIKVGYGPDSK